MDEPPGVVPETESALRIGLGEHLPALVKKPAVCEVSFAQIVRSIARGIE